MKTLLDNNTNAIPSCAISLLNDCVGAKAGDRLLIVVEPSGTGYYDDEAPKVIAAAGRAMGMKVYETQAPAGISAPDDMEPFLDTLHGFDQVIFFARVGDQIRFSISDKLPPATMVYTLGRDMLESSFGTASHTGLCEIRDAIDQAFDQATEVHVTCPRGTDYRGMVRMGEKAAEVGVKRFPMLVPRPVPAAGFEGRIILSRFLVGTGSRFYEPYYLALESDVAAIVKDNRIIRFEGDTTEVQRVEQHYQHVAGLFDIDPWYIHSWHAGIHPACEFNQDATSDILRWAGSAFGSPRILHFHTCGNFAPGEISWNIADPTIHLDGQAIWENGYLYPDRLAGSSSLLQRHPRLAALYQSPHRNIGLNG